MAGKLHREIGELSADSKKHQQALKAGNALLQIYDELQYPSYSFATVYYDLFQITITRAKTRKLAMAHIQKAYEHAFCFYGDDNNKTVQKFKSYIETPWLHKNHAWIN